MKDKVESVNNLSARGVSRQRKIIIAVLAGMCFVGDGQQSYAIGTGGAQGDTDIGDARTFKFKDRINVKFGQGKPSGYAANALYNVVEGTSSDYNYKQETVNADGTVTVHYYKITLNAANTGTSSNISWTEVSSAGADTIQIKLPNNQVKYLKYTYTQPSGYTVDSSSYTSTNLANNVTNKVFSASSRIDQKAAYSNQAYGSASANISTASYGGSIYNHTSNSSIDITSDFNGSSLIQTLTGGTALAGEDYTYAEDDFASSTDGSASANADAYASAWAEANASSSAYGGAIGNTSSGSLGNVKGDFVKNYVQSNAYGGYAEGGYAEAHAGDAKAVAGDAYASSDDGSASATATASASADATCNTSADANGSATAGGGAIGNLGTMGNVTGDFVGNYAHANAKGGTAIHGSSMEYSGTATAVAGSATADASNTKTITHTSSYYNDEGKWVTEEESITLSVSASSSTSGSSDWNSDYDGGYYHTWKDGTTQWINSLSVTATANSSTYEYENTYWDYSEHADATANAYGGAIYNSGKMGNIVGNFIGNYVLSTGEGGSAQNNGVYTYAYGGGIYNYQYGTIGTILGDFTGNYAKADLNTMGGGIYNSRYATIAGISGDFNSNYVTTDTELNLATNYRSQGGAIYNEGAITNGITDSTFTGNYAIANYGAAQGGALYHSGYSSYKINNISADFSNNYASSTNYQAQGGAIYNTYSSSSSSNGIGNVSGDFIGNYVSALKEAQGGAIYNNNSIDSITGTFSSNYAKSETTGALGGAIYNNSNSYAKIGSITADFIGNYVYAIGNSAGGAIYNINNSNAIGLISGDFINNHVISAADASGGAIYNTAVANGLASGTYSGNYVQGNNAYGGALYNTSNISNGIKNVSFIDNYAHAEEGGTAQGGAIYTTYDLNIIADNGTSKFSGNYVQVGDGPKESQAVWLQGSGTNLTLTAQNNGNIIVDDTITGQSNYTHQLYLTGDSTGQINLNGVVKNAEARLNYTNLTFGTNTFADTTSRLYTNSGTVNLQDNEINNYNINYLSSSSNARWELDVDLANQKADTITIANGSGSVYINAIDLTDIPLEDGSVTVQVLKNGSGSSVYLALNSALTYRNLLKETETATKDAILANTNWSAVYSQLDQIVRVYGQLSLTTTDTNRDSITYTTTSEISGNGYSVQGDTLKLWNQLNTTETKNFNFDAASNTYTVGENLGATSGSVSNVNGVASGSSKSTINMNGKTGFELSSGKTLTLSNVNITNAVNSEGSVVNASGGTTNLSNVTIASSNSNAAIKNAGTLNVTGGTNTLNSGISGTGSTNVNNGANLTLANGVSITQNTVNVNNGSLNVSDTGKVNANLNIGTQGSASMSANSITSAVSNSGNLSLSGGTVSKAISGSGTTTLKGNTTNSAGINQGVNVNSGVTLTNNAALGSDNGKITNAGTINTNANNIKGAVTNNNALNLSGGTLSKAVSGSGTTTISANATNNGGISQNVNVSSGVTLTNNAALGSDSGTITNAGTITSDASNIKGSVTNNNTLNLSGGTLSKVVSGSGTTNITGDVTSNSAISQAISITSTGGLTINASNVGGNVANSGDLILNGGTLNKVVSGSGTTNIVGEVTSNSAISQEILITAVGDLTINADNVGGVVTNEGILTLTGGSLTHQVIGTGSLGIAGNVTNNDIISQNVIIKDSGNLTNNNNISNVINYGVLTSKGEYLTGTIENNKTLNLSGSIGKTVSGNGTTYVANSLTFKDGADIVSTLNLSNGAVLSTSGNADSSYAIGTLTGNGEVNVTTGSLQIDNNAALNNLANDGKTNIGGTLAAANNITNTNELTVNGKVSAKDVTNSGTLTLKNGAELEDIVNSGNAYITGKTSAENITNNEGNIFNAEGDVNAQNITNKGDMDIDGNTETELLITNSGSLDVTGSVTGKDFTNSGNANVGEELTLTGTLKNTNSITVNSEANLNDVTNSGTLTLKNDADIHNLTNENTVLISGNADVNNIINNKHMSVDGNLNVAVDVKNTDTLTVKKDLNVTGNITTSKTLDVTGSVSAANLTNEGSVSVGGTLTVSGDVSNTNTITVVGKVIAEDVTNSGNLTFRNGAEINDFINNGSAYITGSTSANNITNNEEKIFNITGDVIAQNITNKGDMDITGNAAAEVLISNSAALDVTGTLTTVDFTNNGTANISENLISTGILNNTDALTVEGHAGLNDVTNSGTLTLKNGADIHDLTNDNIVKITGNANTNNVVNNKQMTVEGSLASTGNVINKDELTVTNNLTTDGSITNTKTLNAGGSVSTIDLTNSGNAVINGSLTAAGNISNTDSLTVVGHVVSKDIENSGIITFQSGADVSDFTNNGEVYITGILNANDIVNNENKIFDITGDVNAKNVTNHGDMDISGNLTVENTINNTGDLDVIGTASAKEIINTGNFNVGDEANVNVTGNLITTENITTSGVLNVEGDVNAKDLTNSGTLIAGNNAEVNGLVNEETGTINIAGNLDVTGIITDDGNSNGLINDGTLNVGGNLTSAYNIINTNDISVVGQLISLGVNNSGNLTVQNNSEIQNFTNSGIASISGTLTSAGIVDNSNELTVLGYADLNSAVNSGTLTLNNGAEITSFTNTKNAVIYNGLNADYIKNEGTIALSNGTDRVGDILNNSQINITNSAFTLDNTITGTGNINITNSSFTTNGEISNQNITADSSTMNFGNNSNVLNNSVLNVTNGSTINTKDGVYTDYVMDELHSSADSRYSIDVTLTKEEQNADTFTLENGGSGTIYISSINVSNECDMNEKYILQIIKSATSDAPQLDYDNSKVLNQAEAIMTSDIILAKEFGLASTTTKNDSLEIRGLQDTFVAWAEYETPIWSGLTEQEDKIFTFVDDSTTILSKDVSELKGINLTINGANNTFDVNNKDFLSSVNENQNVTISNINITNNNDEATDNKGILNLNNVKTDKDIINNNDLNMTGVVELANVTNNSKLSFDGSLMTVKDFENKADIDIKGNTAADNITNSGNIKAEGDIAVKETVKNEKDGEITVDGSVYADKIDNDGNMLINNDVKVTTISNTGTAIIKGNTTVKEITNTEGSADITGNLIVENIYNDEVMTVTGDMDTSKITNLGTINVNESTFNVNEITTEERGTINLKDTVFTPAVLVENQDIIAQDSTVNLYNPYAAVNDSLVLNQSTMNIGNLTTNLLHFTKFELNDGSTVNINSAAVDFTTNTMGRITADEYAQAGEGTVVNLNSINVLNNIANNITMVEIPFADESFAENVKYHGQKTVYTPVYQFGASYNYRDGDMVFVRGGYFNPDTGKIEYPSNPSDAFNPSVLGSAVAAQAAAASQMNQTFNYAFQNSDNFMLMPKHVRMAEINKNKVAIAGIKDTGENIELQEQVSTWYKPYVSFENIPLKDGPKVNSITYGSLFGFDTPIKEWKHGWARTFTGYGGYNGASIDYKNIGISQNGGVLGGTVTLYKGNFFNATTLSAGANLSDISTMYGHEDAVMLMAGVGNKTGYNLEFKDGKFIIQPNLMLAYTFINTFDYKNSAGAKIDSDPLHAIQVAPGVKFIANTKNGWQPYIAANAVMNFMDKSRVMADNVRLPEMSIKPFVQYGVGIQKVFKDNFMAFGSAMLQSGGRNGITLNLGLRWALEFGHHTDMVQAEPAVKKFELLPDIEDKPVSAPEKTYDVVQNVIELDTSNDAAVNVQNVIKEQPDNKSDVIQLEVTEPLDKGPLVLRSVKY